MNTVVSPFTAFLKDVVPTGDQKVLKAGVNPVHLDELIHELRQPLGVIESLACFIELTTTDEKIIPRVDHIQSTIVKIHHMLEDAALRGLAEWPTALPQE